MKKLLFILALAIPFAIAQDAPKTKFYAMHWSAAKCQELAAVNGQSVGLCGQGVEVFIITRDSAVKLYQITVNYVDADGQPGAVVWYQAAAEFRSSASSATTLAWIDLADATLGEIRVTPYSVHGAAAHL